MSRGRRHRTALAALLLGALTLTACTATRGDPTPTPQTTEPSSSTPTPEPLPWGPTEPEVQAAIETAATMSDEEVAGQVILGRYPGTDPAAAAEQLTRYHLGGLVLFGENVASLEQVRATAEAVQEAQTGLGRSWPAIFAVDNEGGPVQRLSAETGPWTSFPDFMANGAADDQDVSRAAAEAMAIELRAAGLNFDFAPRSEERRVGKEGRSRWFDGHGREKCEAQRE